MFIGHFLDLDAFPDRNINVLIIHNGGHQFLYLLGQAAFAPLDKEAGPYFQAGIIARNCVYQVFSDTVSGDSPSVAAEGCKDIIRNCQPIDIDNVNGRGKVNDAIVIFILDFIKVRFQAELLGCPYIGL